jgi:probable rRNA maturation factor
MISISNRQRARKMDLRLLEKIAATVLSELNIHEAELGIVLVGAKEMASLNEKFLQHEGPTDVITFDYSDSLGRDGALRRQRRVERRNSAAGRAIAHVPPAIRARTAQRAAPTIIHGEIFICVSEAVRQAKEFGTDWFSELGRYIIHGILHLTGHDDLEPVARKKMKREENRLVRKTLSLM